MEIDSEKLAENVLIYVELGRSFCRGFIGLSLGLAFLGCRW